MKPWLISVSIFLHALSAAHPRAQYAEFPPRTGKQIVLIEEARDGDTLKAFFLVPTSIRLYGINAHEINTVEGKAARDALAAMVPSGSRTEIELVGHDKYGRTLAKVLTRDGEDASTCLIGAGHGKAWDGQGPKP